MLKVRNLNNATILLSDENGDILIDPWLIGDIYYGSWSPEKYLTDYNFLNDVKAVIISHIHEDHWDIETLKKLHPATNFFIPSMKFNVVIKNKLNSIGFQNINFIDFFEDTFVLESFSIRFIECLNALAQDFSYHEGYETDATSIDTGILISHKPTKTNHLFLCDNTPYDLNRLKNNVGNIQLTSFWFPYNGFAQDYPLCYENLSIDEKRKISLKMSTNREKIIINSLKELEPLFAFPYSSDFTLNGKKFKEFFLVHDKTFLERESYSQRLSKHLRNHQIKTICDYLNIKDEGYFKDNNSLEIKREQYQIIDNKPSKDLNYFSQKMKNSIHINLFKDLKISTNLMFDRLNNFNIQISEDINDWALEIIVDKKIYTINYKNKSCQKGSCDKALKKLTLIVDSYLLSNILERNIHWNNAQIGCFLSWKRTPNEFNQSLYKTLNFLHL